MLRHALLALALLVPSVLPAAQTSAPAAPRALPRFDASPAALREGFEAAKARLVSELDAVAALPAAERSFANTVAGMEAAYSRYQDAVTPLSLLPSISPDAAVRKAADELKVLSASLLVDLAGREDLYRAVKDAAAKGETLTGEDKRLLEVVLRGLRRGGMELDAERRGRLQEVSKKLAALEAEFASNLNRQGRGLEVPRDQLEGLPEEAVKALKPVGADRVLVTLDYPTLEPFMETVKNPALRQRLEYRLNTQAKRNIPLLSQMLRLRQEQADLLGYPTFAHFATEPRMAKEPGRIQAFLDRLAGLLRPGVEADKAELLALKSQDQPKADRLYHWDLTGEIGGHIGYYLSELKKRRYAVDPEEVRQYFPVDHVVPETLRLYEEILGLKFREVPASEIEPGELWHPSVRLFEVYDAASGERRAHFYLDLYPRPGKFTHAMAESVVVGRSDGSGPRESAAAMVANFTPASGDRPALLSHSEVETFFHEFGHVMHQTLGRTHYRRFNGFYTALDFVEAPSQMLEEFVWRPEVLERLSGHWQNQSRKLPRELLDKMLAAQKAGAALGVLRLVALSAADMAYHAAVPKSTTRLLRKVFRAYGYLPPTPGTHFQSRWGHIAWEYAAGYYGYLWSKVFALDIFSRFEREGVLNPAVGLDYRRKVLEPGATKDEDELLKDFLGREPNEEAFLKGLGL